MTMMRWFLVGLTIFGFSLAILSKNPAWLGFGVVVGFVGLFGTVFSMAADRVSDAARPESAMATAEDLAAMRARRAAATVKTVPPAARAAAPDQPAPQ